MPGENEDKLDRNNRNISDNGDRVRDDLHRVGTQVAVLTSQMESLNKAMEKGFVRVEAMISEIKAGYATTADIERVKKDIEGVKTNITWGVRIIVSLFIGALAILVFKTGLAHP